MGYSYLFFQIWVWIVASFILGWLAHWFLCCRGKESSQKSSTNNAGLSAATSTQDNVALVESNEVMIDESWKPQGFSARPETVDDLKRIKGVGSVIEETLNGLGIYQFSQIESWDDQNVSWIENFLAFPGRIEREAWVAQAKTLSTGGTTEFAKRVDKGDVNY